MLPGSKGFLCSSSPVLSMGKLGEGGEPFGHARKETAIIVQQIEKTVAKNVRFGIGCKTFAGWFDAIALFDLPDNL